MSFFDDAISTIGQGLAQTANKAFTDATGYDIGGTLGFLFGDGQATGGANLDNLINTIQSDFSGTSDQLNFLNETLTQQSASISNIGNELSAINQSVQSISLEVTKIETLLQQIQQQQLFISWQNVDVQVQVYVNAINTAYQTYGQYIQNYSTTPTTEVNLLIENVLNSNDGPKDGLNGISSFMLGSGMQQGVLQLWSEMVSALVVNGVMDYRDAVSQYMDYYKKLVFAQLTATNLLMEAYTYNGDPTNCAQAYTDYKTTILSQEETFIQWLLPIINAGVQGGEQPGYTYNYLYSAFDANAQLNPNFSTLANFTEYYKPSPILDEAESMLSSLYCGDTDDRRIVVHMLYLGTPVIANLLSNQQITLTSVNDPNLIITPSSSVSLGNFTLNSPSSSFPDQNFDSDPQGYYIQRFVFSSAEQNNSLPDGTYTLTNLNGKGNLVPQSTYASWNVNGSPYGNQAVFLTNSVLTYTVVVDETTKFDFMNFMAYSVPSPMYYNTI